MKDALGLSITYFDEKILFFNGAFSKVSFDPTFMELIS
jgi:hypothetical protein